MHTHRAFFVLSREIFSEEMEFSSKKRNAIAIPLMTINIAALFTKEFLFYNCTRIKRNAQNADRNSPGT
jgi:hypothetical protein